MDSASDVLEDALSFPMSDDDWVVTILIGGVVAIAGVLLLPFFILQGYFVAVIREVLAGEDLPEWGDVGMGDLLVDGLKLTAVGLVYALVLVVPFFLLTTLGAIGGAAGGDAAGAVVGLLVAVFVLVYFVGVLVVSYFLPAAIVNFARHRSVGAAFDFGTIRDVVTNRDYLVGWLLAIAINLLSSVVISVLFVTIIGILLAPWVSFFFNVAYFYVFARAYAGALDLDIPLADVSPAEV